MRVLAFWGAALGIAGAAQAQGETRVAVVFSGGHEINPLDRGRPVLLVAGALGVRPEVFREAFSRVHPARDRQPTPDEQRQNKSALLGALLKYGITNERLDEVSDHYRYRREQGESWPTRAAKAFAVLSKGKIVRFVVVDPGEGYSSAPSVQIPGLQTQARVTLSFDRRFEKNGSITSILLDGPSQ